MFALTEVELGSLWRTVLVVAGIGAALLANGACVVHDRYVATDRLTTGEPLSPW